MHFHDTYYFMKKYVKKIDEVRYITGCNINCFSVVEGSLSLSNSIKNTKITMFCLQHGQQNSFQVGPPHISPYLNMPS